MVEFFESVLLPSNLIILLSIAGIILSFRSVSRRAGKYLVFSAVGLYILFSTGPVSFWLLGNLEYQYPQIKDIDSLSKIEHVVVLAGYAERDSLLPLSSWVNRATAFRLLETLRIANVLPESSIIVTGNKEVPEIMKGLLAVAGIVEDRIIVEHASRNTYDSARNVGKWIKSEPFLLVTSAGHMPRSMRVFMKLGMSPVPAPTDYRSRRNYLAIDYLPSPLHLEYSELEFFYQIPLSNQ